MTDTQAHATKTVTVELGANEMLIRIPVVREYESGDWEHSQPGYWYATVREFDLLDETLDEEHAAGVVREIEGGDLYPDGWTVLDRQLTQRFAERREAFEARRFEADGRGLTLHFPPGGAS